MKKVTTPRRSHLGMNVYQLRLRHDVSLTGVAKAAHISKAALCAIEQGSTKNPSVLTVQKIADFFGVTIDSLLKESVL